MLFARASLKPVLYVSPFRLLFGYPVLFARASLKPHRRTGTVREGKRLPRAFCAGLIEAPMSASSGHFMYQVTPCFLRGPH